MKRNVIKAIGVSVLTIGALVTAPYVVDSIFKQEVIVFEDLENLGEKVLLEQDGEYNVYYDDFSITVDKEANKFEIHEEGTVKEFNLYQNMMMEVNDRINGKQTTEVNKLEYNELTPLKELLDAEYKGSISMQFANKGSEDRNNRVTIDEENEYYTVVLDHEDGQEPTEMTFNTKKDILNWLESVGLI